MKKVLIILFVISCLILTIFKVNANNLTFPLIGKVFVLDAGHGGVDNGASYLDIVEDDINLAIVLYLGEELEKNGATVILTRDGDYDLSKPNALYRKKSDFDNRIKLINNSNADMYLSIHLNYFVESKYYGAQVFYTTGIEANENIAKILQEELNNNLGSKRVAKINSSANYMFNKLNVPGVLVECGFLSNYNERNKLTKEEYQKEIATILTGGILKYYN